MAATPFSLVQAGGSLIALKPDGSAKFVITLPSGVTMASDVRVRASVLNRKIIVAGKDALLEPIWIRPQNLSAYKLRILAPASAPILTGGASGAAVYGWYSFIQKIDGIVVNESPLSPSSGQSTSKVFTAIAVSTNADVTGRRLYRTVDGGTVPFQVVDIDDNTTTTLATNSVTSAALSLLPSDPQLGIAPTDLDLIVSWRDRMWGRSNTATQRDNGFFTEVDQPWAWALDNFVLAQPVGEDDYGITGWLPRKDELGMLKRSRVLKVIGTGIDADFDVLVVAEGIGCISPDSCVTIRDIGYFLSTDGPYKFGPAGVDPIFDQKVVPWFQTDDFFNREMFASAVGGYNPYVTSYDLHLAAAGSTVLDRWVSYDIKRGTWTGPHVTNKMTPYGRGLLRDTNGQFLACIGGSDGYLYRMNQLGASDGGTAIPIDWLTNPFHGGAPDIEHVWQEGALLMKAQRAVSIQSLKITPYLGDLSEDGNLPPVTAPFDVDMNTGRARLPRLGTGRVAQLQFTHNIDGEDVELYGLELPFFEQGRR